MSGPLNINTIETVDKSYLCTRFKGFRAVQENSWYLSHQFLLEEENPFHFLIHDNDRKFTNAFVSVLETEDFHVINTPFRAPHANAYAERWVRTVREECLDHILIISAIHLQRVMLEFIDDYYNVSRPH